MGHGVVRINGDGLVVTDDCLRESVFRKSVPVKTASQISFVCQWVVSATFSQTHALVTCQMGDYGFCNVCRDRIFQAQNVGESFVKLAGPNGRAVTHTQQLEDRKSTRLNSSH